MSTSKLANTNNSYLQLPVTPCIHQGKVIGTHTAKHTEGNQQSVPVYQCSVHKECINYPDSPKNKVANCINCNERNQSLVQLVSNHKRRRKKPKQDSKKNNLSVTDARVDVVMPYHPGTFEYIEEVTKSILNQTDSRFILHLIADGVHPCDDPISNKFNQISNVRKYYSAEPVGPFISVMRVFNYLETDLILISDADDISLPHRIEHTIDSFSKYQIDIFGASMRQFIDYKYSGPRVQRIIKKQPVLTSGNPYPSTPHGNVIHATMCIKKATFEKLNGYFDSMTSADTHLIRRAGELGCSIYFSKEIIALRRLRKNSLSHSQETGIGTSYLNGIHTLFEEHYSQIKNGIHPEKFGKLNNHRTSNQLIKR